MAFRGIAGGSVLFFTVFATLVSCGGADDSGAPGAGAVGGGVPMGDAGSPAAGGGGAPMEAGAGPGTAGEGPVGAGGDRDEGGAAGAGGGIGPEVLNPPDNLNLKLCQDSGGSPQACVDCCSAGGFLASTTYNNQCVCGTPSDDEAVCGTKSAATCFACCNQAGFSSVTFTDGQPTQCTCQNKFDAMVCASALEASDPDPACRICCLNRGFLRSDYDATGSGECTCRS